MSHEREGAVPEGSSPPSPPSPPSPKRDSSLLSFSSFSERAVGAAPPVSICTFVLVSICATFVLVSICTLVPEN